MKNLNKESGLIKEILVIIAVIFILAYYNLDPKELWAQIVDFYNAVMDKIRN